MKLKVSKNIISLIVGSCIFVLNSLPSNSIQENKYFCSQLNSEYITFVRTPRGNIPIITFVNSAEGWSTRRRCIEVSKRFQRYSDNGILKQIVTGTINSNPVLCAVPSTDKKCTEDNVLVTLIKDIDRHQAVQQLMDLRSLATSGRTIRLNEKLAIYKNKETYVSIEKFIEISPVINENVTILQE